MTTKLRKEFEWREVTHSINPDKTIKMIYCKTCEKIDGKERCLGTNPAAASWHFLKEHAANALATAIENDKKKVIDKRRL